MNRLVVLGALTLLSAALYATTAESKPQLQKATFAGGCFWCTQSPFDHTPGVVKTTVGYTGGRTENPSYKEVSSGKTGHAEGIEVIFDPKLVTYEKLLGVFWENIDPTTRDRQFPDVGTQYRTAIFYHSEAQKQAALQSIKELEKSKRFDKPIVTEVVPASVFWPAEEYHQKYYLKSPESYKQYNENSGRKQFFKRIGEVAPILL